MAIQNSDDLRNSIELLKGQSFLDTEERWKKFVENNSFGWDGKYEEFSKLWMDLPKKKIIRKYPLQLDLELSSICNLACSMCFTTNISFKKSVNKTFMLFSLFKKIIDEVKDNVYVVRFNLRGEPLLNPIFIQAIEYAKSKGIKEVSTITNASNLDLPLFIKSVKAGMDRFTISIDGLEDEYNKIRKPLKFKKIINNLEKINNYKKENNLIKPIIKIQGVWPSIKKNPKEYYNVVSKVSDIVAFNPLLDWLHNDNNIEYVENFSCPTLYQRLVIGSDGLVLMCIGDEEGKHILGNANEDTIYKIWNGEEINKIRNIHIKNDFLSLEPCRKCWYPRKSVFNEEFNLNGKIIKIANQINRVQEIGK